MSVFQFKKRKYRTVVVITLSKHSIETRLITFVHNFRLLVVKFLLRYLLSSSELKYLENLIFAGTPSIRHVAECL